MNKLEKIFSLIINFGDSEKRVPEMGKLLQSLHARLQNILNVIREIGEASGVKDATSALKVYDNTIKSAEKSKKKFAETDKAEEVRLKDAAKYVDDLKTKYGNLIFTKRDIATLSKNYAVLQRTEKGSVEELTAKINIMATAWKKMGAEQRNSVAGRQVTADLKRMREELRKTTMAVGDNTKNIGNYVSGLYGALSSKFMLISSLVMGFKRLLWSIFQPFQDLEYRMSMVKAVTQATDEEIVALEADARRLGATTQYTATQVAGLQIVYGQMGFVPEQIIAITEATLDLATATGEDLVKSADIAGSTLRAYNLDVSEMPRVIDVMTLALNKSALKLDIFGEAMKYVGPIAVNTGVSIEECSALIGVLADQGIRGSMAGTSLRRILSELAADGRPLNERLAELSKTGISVTDAMDEVGRHAMTALTIIGNNTQKVDELVKAFDNAAGAAKATAAITRDNMRTDGLVFLSAVKEKLISIGECLAPLARWIIQTGTTAVANIRGVIVVFGTYIGLYKAGIVVKTVYLIITGKLTLAETTYGKAMVVNLLALRRSTASTLLFAAAKLLLTGRINGALFALGQLRKSLMANPWGLAIAVVAAVGAGLAAWISKVNNAKKAIKDFSNQMASAEQDATVKIEKEKSTLELLNKIIHDNSASLEVRRRAIVKLNQIVPDYNAHLTDEGKLLNDNTDALKRYLAEKESELKLGAYDDMYSDILKEQAQGQDAYDKASNRFRDARYDKALQGDDKPIIDVQSWFKVDEYSQAQKALNEEAEKLSSINEQLSQINKRREVILKEQFSADNVLNKDGGGGDKGEWSLSKDKEHNRQLLDLKKQLFSGEIASEEAYQKQVLQLEIDTLTERIAANRDSAEDLAKLRQDLLDKQIQQQKSKAEEAYAANRRAQADAIARYDIQHREAEVQRMSDCIDKKIQLNDLAVEKSLTSAQREYDGKIAAIDKEIEANKGNQAKINEIEAEKALLFFAHDQKCIDIRDAGADARVKILRDATQEELTEYGKLPGKAAETERQITENKRLEVEKRKKLTKKGLADADSKFTQNEQIADAVYGTDPKDKQRQAAKLKNEIELREAKAQTYMEELKRMQENGEEESAQYQQTIDNLGKLKKEAENLAKGLETGGGGGGFKGWLMRSFEITPEQVEQLKQQAVDLALQIGTAMVDAQKQASQRRLNNEKKAIDSEYKIHSKLLDDKRDKGLISEKTYQKEMEKLEADKAKKEEAAERAAFEEEKELNIMQAMMNTAIAITKAFAQFGPLAGIPFAVMAAAAGAVQVATISSQKYEQGGIIPIGDKMGVVKGRSHAQGGHQLYIDGRPLGEIESDELIAIVNKHDTRRIGALSAANSVHGRKFASGGLMFPNGVMTSQVAPPVSIASLDAQLRVQAMHMQAQQVDAINAMRNDTRQQIEAINNRIDTLKVVVVESDITEAQNNIKKIKVRSTW